MRNKLLGMLFMLAFLTPDILSQEVRNIPRVLESVWNKRHQVNVIPDDALSGNYEILVYPYILRDDEQDGIIYALEVSWESAAIGGRYIMEITPLQVLLYSQHDNPNSNYLYWMHNLQDGEYQVIKAHLEKLASDETDILTDSYSGKLCFMYNWLFTDPALRNPDKVARLREHTIYEKLYDQAIRDHLYLNAFIVVKEINECLKNTHIDFPEKDDFFRTKIIRMINDKSELNDTGISADLE
ncbi:hypothetical protein [Dysgonomonas capnocytophagoides]|uniref:hypothetical protein n=1 Tax=Dysgonomonas capnocytophagoides TaxID=45254 RepID=UPI0033414951